MKRTLLIINDPLNLLDSFFKSQNEFEIISPQNIRNWLQQKLLTQRFISDPVASICFSDEILHPITEECEDQSCFLCNSRHLTNQGIEILGILQPLHNIKRNFPPQARKLQIFRLSPQIDHSQQIDLLNQIIMRILAIKIEEREKTLFLSYHKKDTGLFADILYNALTNAGFNPFLDNRDLKIGDLWQSELEERLRTINLMIYVESKNSFKSKWINFEIENAKALGIPIFILQTGSKEIEERNIHVKTFSPDYDVKPNEDIDTIVECINDELLTLISQRLFQLRRIISGLFELTHHQCIELSLSKPNLKDHYMYFIKEETNERKIQTEGIITKWIHSIIYPEDVELFKNRVNYFKHSLPQFNCKALLYSDLPDYKTEHGKKTRNQLFDLAETDEISLYQINEVDKLGCNNMMDRAELLNLPSFQSLLKSRYIFLSSSFDQIISGVPNDLDHNVASYLLREVVQLILTNEGKLIFGGHPSVSKIVYQIASRLMKRHMKNILLYQSEFFRQKIPEFIKDDKDWYNQIIWSNRGESRDDSLTILRRKMLHDPTIPIDLAIFIGGGKGLLEESMKVKEYNPSVIRIFLTGAGGYASELAKEENAILFDNLSEQQIKRKLLENDKDFQFDQLDKEKLQKILFWNSNL